MYLCNTYTGRPRRHGSALPSSGHCALCPGRITSERLVRIRCRCSRNDQQRTRRLAGSSHTPQSTQMAEIAQNSCPRTRTKHRTKLKTVERLFPKATETGSKIFLKSDEKRCFSRRHKMTSVTNDDVERFSEFHCSATSEAQRVSVNVGR